MKVLLAQPRGFCAGVTRAIAIVERALAIYGAPIYVRHEIVHNRTVVEELKAKERCLSTIWRRSPTAQRSSFQRTACTGALPRRPPSARCGFLTQPARW